MAHFFEEEVAMVTSHSGARSESPCRFGIGMPENFRVGATSANMETALFGKVCTDSFDLPTNYNPARHTGTHNVYRAAATFS